MRNQLRSTVALLVLLPLPVLYACEASPTDIGKAKDSEPVSPQMTRLVVAPENLNLQRGETAQLEILLEREGIDLAPPELEVAWTSSDPGIVSVSDDGEVTALWEGDVLISARYGGWRAEARVSVAIPPDHPGGLGG